MPATRQPIQGQTCPQCYSPGLHPKAKKCRYCGSSLEKPLPAKWRLVILAICMAGAALTMGMIYLYAQSVIPSPVCHPSQAGSTAC